jgi:hypothetical protein
MTNINNLTLPAKFKIIGSDIIYLHVRPAKFLLNSTLVYEVIMRGDVFALNSDTQELTVVKRSIILPIVPVSAETKAEIKSKIKSEVKKYNAARQALDDMFGFPKYNGTTESCTQGN